MQILKKFNVFRRNWYRREKYKHVIVTEKYNYEIPDNNTIVLTKKNNTFAWAKFKCPCKCGTNIIISLNSTIKPYWSVKVHNDRKRVLITLNPSIHLSGFKCNSHFFIYKNKVYWV